MRTRLLSGRKGTLRLTAVVGLGLALVVGVGVVRDIGAKAAASAGCVAAAEGTIAENATFTPYSSRRSKPPQFPINPQGAASRSVPAVAAKVGNAVGGVPLQLVDLEDSGAAYLYYLGTHVSSTMTPPQFWASGGIQVDVEPANPDDSFTKYLLSEFPTRAVPVMVGLQTAVIVWADPDENGVRTHNIYWTDGSQSYSLIADRSAAQVVSLARGIACG